ncbi:four-carbon acid sugar kinase family protein [Tropicimonas sp. IMCC34043]|uniref:four-carbon acid sugar kinase family protein n=1 Tax=Tropicimonas sp. IMCC34043 TaxID=2248760 RepID=UPI000E24A7BE|nr:four-carbon acid sugar kinase family protein [Tropicimonas sp. IMCC34043]
MLLGCIADDFTGASDLGNTLTRAGLRTTLMTGLPASHDAVDCEAGVIALKTRPIPVAEALMQALGTDRTVFVPTFPSTGRRVFMGHLFVNDTLLNECGTQDHPLTPMKDADIRRVLASQSKAGVGHLPLADLRACAAADRLGAEARAGRPLIVCDAIEDSDLIGIAEEVADWPLITGGSGIGRGLAANFRKTGVATSSPPIRPAENGPAVVLSGSCSRMSNLQVAHAPRHMPGFAIDPTALMSVALDLDSVKAFVRASGDGPKIIYSTADHDGLETGRASYDHAELAKKIEDFFGDLARDLVAEGHRRIVVGGGETSGAVVGALGREQFDIGPEIDPGVPALVARDGLRITLKSGNFGQEDFYDRALRVSETA